MAATVPVAQHAGEHISRPLKTGLQYALVLGVPLIHGLAFDKLDYEPGETAQLRVAGAHLHQPLELLIEADDGRGWEFADSITVEPAGDGASASAQWKIPNPGAPRAAVPPDSHPDHDTGLDSLKFMDGDDLSGCDTAWMSARVHGLDGAQVQFILEREDAGTFIEAGEATATVRGRDVHAGVKLA